MKAAATSEPVGSCCRTCVNSATCKEPSYISCTNWIVTECTASLLHGLHEKKSMACCIVAKGTAVVTYSILGVVTCLAR